jgi:phosphoserine phosphatase
LPRALIPFAICYDFDGTLAPGNMQERDFIPAIGMNKASFWSQVKALARKHEADEILMYMWLMLNKANAKDVQVMRRNFVNYGRQLKLFKGAEQWFDRINYYGKLSGLRVTHHVISSGIREMILGTSIRKTL